MDETNKNHIQQLKDEAKALDLRANRLKTIAWAKWNEIRKIEGDGCDSDEH